RTSRRAQSMSAFGGKADMEGVRLRGVKWSVDTRSPLRRILTRKAWNMGQLRPAKALINESKYPYIVELAVNTDELNVDLSRLMMDFHRSRKIQVRHGGEFLEKTKSFFVGVFVIWLRPVRS